MTAHPPTPPLSPTPTLPLSAVEAFVGETRHDRRRHPASPSIDEGGVQITRGERTFLEPRDDGAHQACDGISVAGGQDEILRDRKSTRLNSSHGYISYAVFCL